MWTGYQSKTLILPQLVLFTCRITTHKTQLTRSWQLYIPTTWQPVSRVTTAPLGRWGVTPVLSPLIVFLHQFLHQSLTGQDAVYDPGKVQNIYETDTYIYIYIYIHTHTKAPITPALDYKK